MTTHVRMFQNHIHAVCLLVLLATAVPCRAQSEPGRPSKVLMVERHGSTTPYDAGLYQAIRAQLSAAPLTMSRVGVDPERAIGGDPFQIASWLAEEYHAEMVFWIEDKEICEVFFYIPGLDGGRINRRVLRLESSSQSSRQEVIAIAVASMVEGLLVAHRTKPVTPAQKQNRESAPDDSSNNTKEAKRRKWVEIFAGYEGALFASGVVTHGVRLGLGFLPIDRLVALASYTQGLPLTLENEEYRLRIISRHVGASAAGRIATTPIDLRMGIAWSIDLRSFSATARSEKLEAEPDGFKGVNSLTPFVSAAWVFGDRIGIFGCMGARLALNETTYKIERDNRTTRELAPFVAKLTYQLGLMILL